MALDLSTLAATAAAHSASNPQEIVALALREYSSHLAISFSGAEDVVLIHMAAKTGLPFRVFSLDTGRLHPDTYQFIDRVRTHYGITIDVMSPQADVLERF